MALLFRREDKRKELLKLSDEQLVTLYTQSSDKETVGILYERYTHLIFTVSYKYLGDDADAEDMVMMIFEKLFEELKSQEIRNFKSWIYTLTKNQCLMQLRHNKTVEKAKAENLRKLNDEIMESVHHEHLPIDDEIGCRIRYLENAIGKLNAQQKQCVELFYLNEKSYREVEDITGLTFNEVKSHLQNGKRNLKLIIERMERHE